MCGIAGKWQLDSSQPLDPGLLWKMVAAIRHRGPDDEGVYVDGGMGLASCRLAILDLSPQGHMPMSNEDGTLWITFNGEIYNFQELREQLIAKGHRFRSRTDTEVVVHLYQEYGVECLTSLRGMFAFAIWDARQRRLFMARDRLGKKPLYYYTDGKQFVFGSEPKAILADPTVPREPDPLAIHYYLTFQYVPSPYSAFRGFRKLPPAHYLILDEGKPLRVERYWKLRYREKIAISQTEACEEIRRRLREAVRLRMISDVPLGAFLSGGLDSSAVVAFMSECSAEPVKTFSIGFEDDAYNELPSARLVAKRFATDHHEFIVKPNAVEVLPDLVWHYNEPYADSSALPTYYLSKLAREHVTVALNGDAGDENFAGYQRYYAMQLAEWMDRLPRWLRQGLSVTARMIPDSRDAGRLLQRGKRFLGHAAEDPRRKYGRWISHFTDAHKAALYTQEFHAQVGGVDSLGPLLQAFADSDAPNLVEAALSVDVALYLPDDLLVKVDIASMAHGLEARSPLLDHCLMEFAASLPSDGKLRGWTKKYLFKQAMAGILPPEIIHRKKMGFGVPIHRWFRHELKDLAMDTLLSPRALTRGYFKPEAVRRLIEEHASGRAFWHHQLWNLLMLEFWHRMFIDGTLLPPEGSATARSGKPTSVVGV